MKAKNKLAILSLLCLPFVASATTYYVSPSGNDSNAGTSPDAPFKTAEKGFKAVHNKDTANLELVIAPGVYDLTNACACAGGSKEANRVIVRGATGNPNDVVLDAKGQFECLRISQHVTVSGLTVSNGINRSGCAAGGIRFAGGSPSGAEFNSIVSNCVVTCCTNTFTDTGNNGAAVVMSYSDLLVKSIVRNNTAKARGAGVLMINNQKNGSNVRGPKMQDCRIEGNESKNSGAGVYVACFSEMSTAHVGDLRDVEIEDCEIVNNVSQEGGAGVFCPDNLDLRVTRCNISTNVASIGSWGGGGLRFHKGLLTISDCTIEGNSACNGGGLDIVGMDELTLYCTNTVIRKNSANFAGGGCRIHEIPRAFFDGCRFEGNYAKSNASEGSGGGLILANQQTEKYGYCSVSNCVFASNKTEQRGGGLSGTWNQWFHGAIVNCVFTNNTSYTQGGGLSIREDKVNGVANPDPAIIRNCLFAFNKTTYEGASNNSTDSNGGGVLLVTYSDLVMENCTIVSNNINNANSSKYISGGIHHRWGGTLKNCIVAYNTVRGQPEPTTGTSSWTAGDNLYINCCGYPAVPRFTAENGCINVPPEFVDIDHGDLRLQPNSPCVDAGQDADWMFGRKVKDLAGSIRISAEHVDIGCYERYFPLGLMLMFK